ncbi:MAG: DNA polymerase III subunit delta [Elusimicrobia bacterium CG08_land_8_20_14_0_20_51_18]|nr:MAG: DNA polymerase III subunit delta [Elusimicrobia bacterium CG08_land_8_20_14_0_20_51_18]
MTFKNKEEIARLWQTENPKLDQLYVFIGEEYSLKEDLLKPLVRRFSPNSFDFSVYDGETLNPKTFVMDAQTPPMTMDRRIMILKRAHKLKAAPFREVLDSLKDLSPSAVLILLYDKPLKQSDAVYSEFLSLKGTLCEFNQMSIPAARTFVTEKLAACDKDMPPGAVELMIEITGTDSGRLSGEIEKLCLYSRNRKNVDEKDVIESSGTGKSENPFELVSAILSRDKKKLVDLTESLLAEKTDSLFIIYMLSSALEKILRILRLDKSGLGGDSRLAYSLGIFRSDLQKASGVKHLSEERMIRLLNRCADAEYLLKTSSGRNPGLVVKNVVYEINKALSF